MKTLSAGSPSRLSFDGIPLHIESLDLVDLHRTGAFSGEKNSSATPDQGFTDGRETTRTGVGARMA
jgi:hypothetical protein